MTTTDEFRPVEPPADWMTWINQPQTPAELAALRAAITTAAGIGIPRTPRRPASEDREGHPMRIAPDIRPDFVPSSSALTSSSPASLIAGRPTREQGMCDAEGSV